MKYTSLFLIIVCFRCQFILLGSNTDIEFFLVKKSDSLHYYAQKLNDSSISQNDRLLYAKKLVGSSNNLKSNSLKVEGFKFLCKNFSQMKQMDSALLYANRFIEYAAFKKDTILLKEAYFRKGYYEESLQKNLESFQSYLSALNFAETTKDSITCGRILVNITNLQNEFGDYSGAQVSASKGLRYLKNKKSGTAHRLYNGLAIAFSNAHDLMNAEKTYIELLDYEEDIVQKAITLNNLANNYRKKREFTNAITIFKRTLADSLIIANASTIARLKDNLGFTYFESGMANGITLMNNALATRVILKDKKGEFASRIHLAKYYLEENPSQAFIHAKRAYQIGKEMASPDNVKEALGYLLQLKPSVSFSKEFIHINDSIIKAKSQLSNSYAGVIFKTEEKELDNLRLSNENAIKQQEISKRKGQLLITIVVLLALSIIAFTLYKRYVSEKKAKQFIARQKDEIEILQKELHHRLKNNLSFIDLFIGLAKGKLSENTYHEKLTELQHRINSMFQVHLQLFNDDNLTTVNFKKYLEILMDKISISYGREGVRLNIDIDSTIELKSLKTFPIGLIINEFVTNSFKYAFPNNTNGEIKIEFRDSKRNYKLRLKDNGIGLPSDFDIENLDSFGLETMKLLTLEQKGTFKLSGEHGVEIDITFPKTEV